ncbi:tyrosine/phenylalanine carboxypeptidase domain-containing protein [Candidatus Coxiella mudrowiae]|uniref:tyrosine/phenylalanine carboxypeptidase domain-containing protein n=1 Tax=Candidatus Coxiella mudrowiae TaxID=2054173 RepID=UPI003CC815C0
MVDVVAGTDTTKLRKDLKFSERILQLYEVYEGWVHFSTTVNGLAQTVCTF